MRPEVARVFERLAASISDGASVDWGADDVQLSDAEQRLVGHLRLIDSLATVYRTLPPSVEDRDDSASPADEDPAGPHWGRLILLDRVGQGASGDVFRAWEVQLQREVALKLLRDDGSTSDAAANARMLQEARRLARVRHPHVVHVYGAEHHQGRIGLWMELVRGRSLEAIIREDGPMPEATASALGADLCGAMAAVHAAGLLHRDIKAQNVIRDESGRSVLMDFGTGEEFGARAPRLAGTPLYLAPEILNGGHASPASDVYSLGVLLFHLVTGAFPVQAESIEGLAAAHRSGRRRPLRSVLSTASVPFAAVVDRALAADPSTRYRTAAEMEQALRAVTSGAGTTGADRPARWRVWVPAIITGALVLALIGSLVRSRATLVRPVADPASLAVLPLTLVSGQGDASLLADGLTDELITTLGQVKALRVTAQTSVMRFKGTAEPISAIAAQLGVGSVLEGSILVEPSPRESRVRVNMRLIRAGTDIELWSDSFDRPLGNLLALESEIARAVAGKVRVVLTPDESARLDHAAQTSAAAQRAYLEGISYLGQNRHGAEVRPALEALQRAIALDPSFAAPHAAAARAYVLLGFDGEISQASAYPAAQSEAQAALALDGNLADAHTALADVSFYYEWNWPAAEAEYRRSIGLDRSGAYARTQFARLLAALGRVDAAHQEADEAVAVDPLSADVKLTQGLMAYYQRRYGEATQIVRQATRMDPRFPGAYFTLGRIEEAQGHLAAAIELTDRAIDLSDTPPWRAQALGLRALAGQTQAARAGLAALQSQLASQHRTLEAPYVAYVRLALGEPDAAIQLLDTAVSSRDPAVLWIAVDPRLDSLRQDTRFIALVARLGRP